MKVAANLGFLFAIGLVIAALQRAPQGAEDDSGYCFLWKNKSSKAADVSCVWAAPVSKKVEEREST